MKPFLKIANNEWPKVKITLLSIFCNDVIPELLRLLLVLLGLDDEERDGEEDGAELVSRLRKKIFTKKIRNKYK